MENPDHPQSPPSMEEELTVLVRKAREGLVRRHQRCEARIRESPTTAMLGAIAVGYILHLLPLRAILVTKVRVISALTRPALLLFGAAKLYELLKKQTPVR